MRVAPGFVPLYRPSTDVLIAPRRWEISPGLGAKVNVVGGVFAHAHVPANWIVLARDFGNDKRVAFRYLRGSNRSVICSSRWKKDMYDVIWFVQEGHTSFPDPRFVLGREQSVRAYARRSVRQYQS